MAKLPKKTEVQSLAFCKRLFNPSQARAWAIGHGFRYAGIDETENQLRVRQHDPSEYQTGSFRTIELRPGVQAVIGRPWSNPGHNPGRKRKPKRPDPRRQIGFGFEETGFRLVSPEAEPQPEPREVKPRAENGRQRKLFDNPGHNPGGGMAKEPDIHAARELELFIDNTERLYRRKYDDFFKNLTAKKAAGKYDRSKAPKLFMYLVEDAAKQYQKEVAGPGHWYETFDKPTRERVARELVEQFEDEYAQGNLARYVPKKYQKKSNPGHNPGNPGHGYYTVIIPWVEPRRATPWHPTEKTGPFSVLSRGAFATEREAIRWAEEHLGNTAYQIEKRNGNPGHNPGKKRSKATATVEEKLQQYARKRGTDLAVKKEKYGASNYVFYRLGERFDAAKSLADGKTTIDRLVKAYPFIVKGSPTYPGYARPEPSTRSSSSAREPWRYPLSTNLGGAIHLVYSPTNQSYFVMWAPRGISQGNVLRNISDRREAEAAVDDLLSAEQRAHWRQKKPGPPPETKPSSNPGHYPGAKTIAQWKRIIRAEQPGAKFGLIVEADKDPRSGMPPGWIRINYSYKDMWGKQHAGREIPPELLKGGVMAKKKKATKKRATSSTKKRATSSTKKRATSSTKKRATRAVATMQSKGKGGLVVREAFPLADGGKVFEAKFFGVPVGHFRGKTKTEATRKARAFVRWMVKK